MHTCRAESALDGHSGFAHAVMMSVQTQCCGQCGIHAPLHGCTALPPGSVHAAKGKICLSVKISRRENISFLPDPANARRSIRKPFPLAVQATELVGGGAAALTWATARRASIAHHHACRSVSGQCAARRDRLTRRWTPRWRRRATSSWHAPRRPRGVRRAMSMTRAMLCRCAPCRTQHRLCRLRAGAWS